VGDFAFVASKHWDHKGVGGVGKPSSRGSRTTYAVDQRCVNICSLSLQQIRSLSLQQIRSLSLHHVVYPKEEDVEDQLNFLNFWPFGWNTNTPKLLAGTTSAQYKFT